jgi:hypothetical protein
VDNRPYRPFWAITKHADIVAIERDNELFISEPRPLLSTAAAADDLAKEQLEAGMGCAHSSTWTARTTARCGRADLATLGKTAFISAMSSSLLVLGVVVAVSTVLIGLWAPGRDAEQLRIVRALQARTRRRR